MKQFAAVFLMPFFLLLATQENFAQVDEEIIRQKSQGIQLSALRVDDFKDLVYTSEKKVKVIYFLSRACGVSAVFTPKLYNLYQTKNKSNFELFVVDINSENTFQELKGHLYYNGFYFPVYLVFKSGFRKVVKELCPTCDVKLIGYGSFFILNKDNELLDQTNYDMSDEDKEQLLKKYIN